MDSDSWLKLDFSPRRTQSHCKNRKPDSKKTETPPATINSDNINGERAIVPTMAGPEPASLSRLRRFPNTKLDENIASSRLRESYAVAAESVRNKQVEEMKKIEQQIDRRCENARAGIEQARAKLLIL